MWIRPVSANAGSKTHPTRTPMSAAARLKSVPAETRASESFVELIPSVLRIPKSVLDLKTTSWRAQTIATDMLRKTIADRSQTVSSLSPKLLLRNSEDASRDDWMSSFEIADKVKAPVERFGRYASMLDRLPA